MFAVPAHLIPTIIILDVATAAVEARRAALEAAGATFGPVLAAVPTQRVSLPGSTWGYASAAALCDEPKGERGALVTLRGEAPFVTRLDAGEGFVVARRRFEAHVAALPAEARQDRVMLDAQRANALVFEIRTATRRELAAIGREIEGLRVSDERRDALRGLWLDRLASL